MARRLAKAAAVAAALAIVPLSAQAATGDDVLSLPPSFDVPASDPAAAGLADRAWTYDAAVWAAAHAATGAPDLAQPVLDDLAAAQRPDGAVDFSFDVRTGAGDGPLRSGAIAWVGLAAAQHRLATCTGSYDALLAGTARWMLDQRAGALVRGGPDVGWISTEHNLEARALWAALADLAGGRTACPGGLDGRPAAETAAQVAELDAAVAGLDAAIDAELFAGDHFRQGAGDHARPIDVQAYGILWLLDQGRRAEAEAVAAYAEAHHRLGWGYRPYAETWTPEVVWTEGVLQMRLAKAALGHDVAAIDAGVAALAQTPGRLPHADRDVASPIGDYHTWPATAPAAWRLLASSGFGLLGR